MYIECMTDRKRQIERLFKQHYRAMFRLASILLHDNEESMDIVHDVFVRLLDDDIRFDSDMACALSCVRNGCLNVMRALAPVSEKCVTFRFIDLKIL